MGRLYAPIRSANRPTLTPPSHLNAAELKEWHYIVGVLQSSNMLEKADEDLLANYCIIKTQFLSAKAILDKDGPLITSMHGLKRHPASVMLTDYLVQMNNIGAKLGLSPTSRAALQAEAGAGPDPITDLLKARPQIQKYDEEHRA